MSVPEQMPIVEYTANGATTRFPITFDLHDVGYLNVFINKELAQIGSYTVDNFEAVIFAVAPNDGDEITLIRDTQLDRETNYQAYDNSFRPAAVNYDFDKIWHVLQEQNLIDGKLLARLKDEIEWRRVHDFNYDELAQAREKQLFDALKGYTDTLVAAVNPGIFQGVIAGVVFANDKKSVQTHLEDIYENLLNYRVDIDSKANIVDVQQGLSLKADLAIASLLEVKKADLIYVDEKISAISGGLAGSYLTYDLALAATSTLLPNVSLKVTNDPDIAKNAEYTWDGSVLVKSQYDILNQSIKYSDSNLLLVKNAAKKINMVSVMQSFGFEDLGTLLSANDATYLFINPSNSLSTLKLVNFKSGKDGAEVKLKAFLKNGSDFEFSRDLVTLISKIGENNIDLTHQQIILNQNEYLAVSVNSPDTLKYVSTATAYNLYYSAGAYATTIPDSAYGRTARIQLSVYTETELDKIPNSINELSYKSASLIKLGCQSIETSSTNAGAAQWIPNQASTITGVIRKFLTYATVAGKVQVGVYTKNGTIFTRKRFVEVDVVVGLNALDINLDIVKGEYAGIRTKIIGLSSYLANNKNAFEIWSGNYAVNEQVYSGPTAGFAWQFNFEVIEKSIPKKAWQDKKITTFGDSITWYDGRQFGAGHLESGQMVIGYQSYMRDILGCNIDNQGRSGWDMTQILSVINSYDFTDVYAVTLTSGANDHRKNVPIGTTQEIGSVFDSTTFTGAMQTAIEKIINSNKDIKIFLITPVRGWYFESGTSNVPGPYKNEQLLSVDYANAIKSLGRLYSIPVLDWYNEVGFNGLNKNYYLGDNPESVPFYLLHPNQKGYKRMGESLAEFLKKY